MKIDCTISIGEYLDKYSILLIKRNLIKDNNKILCVDDEIKNYDFDLINTEIAQTFILKLIKINEQIWNCNELRKLKIKNNQLDTEFIELSVLESNLNNSRFYIKQEINKVFNSNIIEVKSYL